LFGASEADARDLDLQNSSTPIEKLIPNKPASASTARTWGMSLIPKTKHALRVGRDEPLHSKQLAYS
jgi:hypothetical protein